MAASELLDPLAISKRIRSRYLLPGERVVVSTRRHWMKLAGPVAITVLTFVMMVGGVLSPAWGDAAMILVYLFLASALFTLWRVLEWRTEWFIATDRRLLKTYGLITQRVAMMPLAKVTDMSYDRSILGRLLGYGEFVMESAGQDQALSKMDLVPRPDTKYVAMCETIFGGDVSDPTEDGPGWGERGQHEDRNPDPDGEHDDDPGSEEPQPSPRRRRERDRSAAARHTPPERDRERHPDRSTGDHSRWEPVERDELPEDWAWVDEDEPRPRHLRPVAVDPDPTPSR